VHSRLRGVRRPAAQGGYAGVAVARIDPFSVETAD
jgi:hypothetical protein